MQEGETEAAEALMDSPEQNSYEHTLRHTASLAIIIHMHAEYPHIP